MGRLKATWKTDTESDRIKEVQTLIKRFNERAETLEKNIFDKKTGERIIPEPIVNTIKEARKTLLSNLSYQKKKVGAMSYEQYIRNNKQFNKAKFTDEGSLYIASPKETARAIYKKYKDNSYKMTELFEDRGYIASVVFDYLGGIEDTRFSDAGQVQEIYQKHKKEWKELMQGLTEKIEQEEKVRDFTANIAIHFRSDAWQRMKKIAMTEKDLRKKIKEFRVNGRDLATYQRENNMSDTEIAEFVYQKIIFEGLTEYVLDTARMLNGSGISIKYGADETDPYNNEKNAEKLNEDLAFILNSM